LKDSLAKRAGNAFFWKIVQLGSSQVITLARTLILARILVPDDFGLISIALVTVNTVHNITDFGMVPALIQQKVAEDAHFNAAWTVGIARAIVITLVVVIGAPMIADLFAEPRAMLLIRAIAFRPLIEAIASIKIAQLTRQLKFRSLTSINLPPVLIEMIVSIMLAKSLGVWALVAGSICAAITYVLMSYLFAPHLPKFNLNLETIRPLIKYGRWIFLSAVVAVLGSSVLQVVISRQLGSASLGIYYLAVKLAFLPHEISAKVVGEVSFPIFARLQADAQKMASAFRSIFTGTSALLFPIYVLLIAIAPTLVEDVLGPRWVGTTPVIRILALAGLIGVFGDIVVPLLKGIGQPYKVAALEAVQSLLITVLVWKFSSKYGLIGASAAWLPALAASQILAGIFLVGNVSRPFRGLYGPLLSVGLASGLGAVAGLIIDEIFAGVLGFLLAASLGLATVVLSLWILNQIFNLKMARTFFTAFPEAITLVRFLRIDHSRL
jgi:lipopolysaccharide exporter